MRSLMVTVILLCIFPDHSSKFCLERRDWRLRGNFCSISTGRSLLQRTWEAKAQASRKCCPKRRASWSGDAAKPRVYIDDLLLYLKRWKPTGQLHPFGFRSSKHKLCAVELEHCHCFHVISVARKHTSVCAAASGVELEHVARARIPPCSAAGRAYFLISSRGGQAGRRAALDASRATQRALWPPRVFEPRLAVGAVQDPIHAHHPVLAGEHLLEVAQPA
jgi:hypothetical protein